MKNIGIKILLICIIGSFAINVMACQAPRKEEKQKIQFSDLQEKVMNTASDLPDMSVSKTGDDEAQDSFEYLFDFPYKDVERYYFSYASKGTAHEIALVQLKTASDAEKLQEAMQNHVDKRVTQFKNYSPDQVDMAQSALITAKGKYVVLIICSNPGEVKNAFEECFK